MTLTDPHWTESSLGISDGSSLEISIFLIWSEDAILEAGEINNQNGKAVRHYCLAVFFFGNKKRSAGRNYSSNGSSVIFI